MVPIAACALAAVVLIIERWRVYRLTLADTESLVSTVREHLRNLDVSSGLVACQNHPSLTALVFRPALVHEVESTGKTRSDLSTVRAILEEQVQLVAYPHLYRRLALLGMLGRVAPLLGLLGTVQGMIGMFLVVHRSGAGTGEALAEGMAVALITTFAGLCVAIPVQAAEGIFEEKTEAAIPRLRRDVSLLLESLRELRFQERVIRVDPSELPV